MTDPHRNILKEKSDLYLDHGWDPFSLQWPPLFHQAFRWLLTLTGSSGSFSILHSWQNALNFMLVSTLEKCAFPHCLQFYFPLLIRFYTSCNITTQVWEVAKEVLLTILGFYVWSVMIYMLNSYAVGNANTCRSPSTKSRIGTESH